jgi:hypothetical protein
LAPREDEAGRRHFSPLAKQKNVCLPVFLAGNFAVSELQLDIVPVKKNDY